jgi:hypothetical protein
MHMLRNNYFLLCMLYKQLEIIIFEIKKSEDVV